MNYSQYSESGHHSKQSKRIKIRKVKKSEHREHHNHEPRDSVSKISKIAKIAKMVQHHHHHGEEHLPHNVEAVLPNSDSIVSSALSGSQRGKKKKRISSKGMRHVSSVGDFNRAPMAHIPDVDEDKYDSPDQDHYIKQH